MSEQPRSTQGSSGRSKEHKHTRTADWSRTPAAMFACIVLGLASISGLAYAWNRTAQRDSIVQLPSGVIESHESRDSSGSHDSNQSRELSAIKRIDINSANKAKLDLLPGIGPALASRIVANRDEHGRFESVDDLQRVSGIGPKTVEKLRALVIVGD